MSKRFKEAEKRISGIFDSRFKDISRRMTTLKHYKKYLEQELDFPVEVCGREDFSWEEFYLLGPGDRREYEVLKRTRASYTDILRLTRLSNHLEVDYGIFGHFTRISDRKRFELPLEDFCLSPLDDWTKIVN